MLNEAFWRSLGDYDAEILGVFRDPEAAAPVVETLTRLGKGRVVADLGCGPGRALPHLAAAARVYAVDAVADLLDRAREAAVRAAWRHIAFIRADLADCRLPEPADLTLLIASFFPDGLRHAIRILANVQRCTRPGGTVLAVVPAMESLLYRFHLHYRQAVENGTPEERLHLEMRDAYARILTYGYFHHHTGGGEGQIVKHWVREELRDLLGGMRFAGIRIDRHPLPWKTYFPQQAELAGHAPPWFWRVEMRAP